MRESHSGVSDAAEEDLVDDERLAVVRAVGEDGEVGDDEVERRFDGEADLITSIVVAGGMGVVERRLVDRLRDGLSAVDGAEDAEGEGPGESECRSMSPGAPDFS